MSLVKIKKKIKDIKLKSDIVNPYQQLINNFPNIITKEKIRDLDNLILEVGCGSGKFLTKYSQMKAGNFVGIDNIFISKTISPLSKCILHKCLYPLTLAMSN